MGAKTKMKKFIVDKMKKELLGQRILDSTVNQFKCTFISDVEVSWLFDFVLQNIHRTKPQFRTSFIHVVSFLEVGFNNKTGSKFVKRHYCDGNDEFEIFVTCYVMYLNGKLRNSVNKMSRWSSHMIKSIIYTELPESKRSQIEEFAIRTAPMEVLFENNKEEYRNKVFKLYFANKNKVKSSAWLSHRGIRNLYDQLPRTNTTLVELQVRNSTNYQVGILQKIKNPSL